MKTSLFVSHCFSMRFPYLSSNILFQGQLSENALESTHKIIRFLLKYRARPFLFEGLVDCYNHLWIRSSPYIKSFSGEKPQKPPKLGKLVTDDDKLFASYIIIEDEIEE